MNYATSYAAPVPQTQPLDARQQPNNGGGFSFVVDDGTRLDRFLILGSEAGSYYVGERAMTRDNAAAALRCLALDPVRAVAAAVTVSESGRASKNDPALFVIALAMTHADAWTRELGRAAIPRVARIGTHILHLASFVNTLGGWGRGTRRAFASWYLGRAENDLAYQLAKYQSRDGWSHRDVLRLCHAKSRDEKQNAALRWAVKGEYSSAAPRLISGVEQAKASSSAAEVAAIVREFALPRECVPSQWLGSPEVWRALLPNLGLAALVRNLGKLAAVGLTGPGSDEAGRIVAHLHDEATIRGSRIHPISVLLALRTYASGHGDKGSLTWTPNQKIVDALDSAFYAAFANVVPTGKRFVIGLDVSGSMHAPILSGSSLSAREATSAVAMMIARTEPWCEVMAFSDRFVPLDFSPRRRLDDIVRATGDLPFSETDCSLPMRWALANGVKADAFVVLTDNETNTGPVHPVEALRAYRNATGIPARLIVLATTATQFTIADPSDAGMLDIAGFDAAAPAILSDFCRG